MQLVSSDGTKIKNLLCSPIRNPEKQIIGVVQLFNKLNEKQFTECDINLLEVRWFDCALLIIYFIIISFIRVDRSTSKVWGWKIFL